MEKGAGQLLSTKEIRGVIPPIVTPVDSRENVDEGALKRVIDYVMAGGVHGIFVMGSNGEFYAFDADNQRRAVEVTVEHVAGRLPVYAGASAITTKEAVALGKAAEAAGADALTVLTPMFIQPNDSELYDHFKTIAEAVELPVLLYNNPGKTTNDISLPLLRRLAEIPNIVGIKNTTENFPQTVRYIHAARHIENFQVLAGSDYLIYATLSHGGVGCVAGTANAAPKLVVEIYEAFQRGDHAGALAAQYRLLPLRDTYGWGSFPVVMKDCLNLLGLDVGPPVKPIDHCSAERQKALAGVLKDLELL